MRRLSLIVILGLTALTGCASDPEPDVAVYDGPYYYDGRGYYYDDPRAFDYDYDRRYVYGHTHYYPGPYYYGGHRRSYYDRHGDRRDTDYRRDDRNSTADRQRERPEPSPGRSADRSPFRDSDNRARDRAVPDRPSKAATETPGRSTRSETNRGSPRGNPGRSRR